MRSNIIAVRLIALGAIGSPALSFDKVQEIRALDFAKNLHGQNSAAVLPTYRNLLEVMNAAKTLDVEGGPVERQLNITKGKPYIFNGTPTIIEQDVRTQSNFLAVAEEHTRIWFGVSTKDATNKDFFPDAVAIKTDRGALCSGALIGPDAVITAAHCFCGGHTPQWVIFGLSTDIGSENTKVVAVDKARSKPKMQCGSYPDGDVALVRISEAVDVPPRKIASSELVNGSKAVRIVGFGLTEQGTSGGKLMVDVPVTSHKCQGTSERGSDANVFGCYPDSEIVASSPLTNQDSCNGDSGGGVFVQTAMGDYVLAAVVSRGIKAPSTRPCGDGGIYARIDSMSVRQWITTSGVLIAQ